MLDIFLQLGLFAAKATIIVVFALLLFAGILMLLGRGKEKIKGQISIKHLNEKYQTTKKLLLEQILPSDKFKQFVKERKAIVKAEKKAKDVTKKNIFVIHFQGDIKASAVSSLREEVTALLSIAKPTDEVVVCLESAGGMIHTYGLAAAQLHRIRQQNIPLTVIVDKVAASGGYLMACLANKILAAPFAIIGSIGVIVQIPNFHRLLKEKNIDFEQLTAGSFKRTLTMFGENTKAGREKLREEIEEIHELFKDVILKNREGIDIDKVATGEHWVGSQALGLKLVDGLETSDDYLYNNSENAEIYEINYRTKKTLTEKLASSVQSMLSISTFA